MLYINIIATLLLSVPLMNSTAYAQNAINILNKYKEITGGQEKWDEVISIKVTGRVKIISQNMELSFLRILMKDGRQFTSIDINEMSYIPTAYDGNVVWGSDSQMKLVQKDSTELARVIQQKKEFPFTTYNWREKGFKVEYLGIDSLNNIAVYKIKLIKDSTIVDGIKTESISTLYIDSIKYLLLLTETPVMDGVNKGKVLQTIMSDYREVQGLWYPFYSEVRYDNEIAQIFITEDVKINSTFNENIFKMPQINE